MQNMVPTSPCRLQHMILLPEPQVASRSVCVQTA